MVVVIAEKPSVGKELAKVMGANVLKDGYVEGNGMVFTWAFGHLIQLSYPEAYGFTEWNKENLPMVPNPFQLSVKQKKGTKGDYVDDPGVKKQLRIIGDLFNKASEIIVATDAGREGELIFRYIYSYLGCKTPFKRLWISSQTDRAIREGFNDLRPGRQYDALFEAAKSRSESDWLVGLNATQALSLSVGKGLYSIGRVQTPTLAMICQRYLQYKNFKPEIFYQLLIVLEKNKERFMATSLAKYSSKEEADKKLSEVKKVTQAEVLKVDVKEKKEEVPLLYDLTALQQDGNRKYGFSAEKTLEIAQKLYESKVITYPRTGSRYIGDDVFEQVPSLIKLLWSYEKLKLAAERLIGKELNKRSVNADKVTDHHALLPTEILPNNLSEDERNIYELIAGRMLESFGEKCIKLMTTVELSANELFIARGTVIKYEGWRSVFNDKEEGEEEDHRLPVLNVGELVEIKDARNEQRQTKPKPLYTEGSLLESMKTCGRDVTDEEAREAMKESGLGTPATRASIIEKLFSIQYIERQKKSIIPTEKGLAVFELIQDKSIGSPEMTGEWEKRLFQIENGKFNSSNFMNEIIVYTKSLTNEMLKAGANVKDSQLKLEESNGIPCPKCKKGSVTFIKNPKLDAAVCSSSREECGFIIFRELAKKKLTDAQLSSLIANRKTGIVKGFTSKSGKVFEAALKLDEAFKIAFVFENGNNSQPNKIDESHTAPSLEKSNFTEMKCPKCGDELLDLGNLLACADKKECTFTLWKTVAKKRIPDLVLKRLLKEGRTDKISGLTSAQGKSFEARLKLNKEFKVVFDFN